MYNMQVCKKMVRKHLYETLRPVFIRPSIPLFTAIYWKLPIPGYKPAPNAVNGGKYPLIFSRSRCRKIVIFLFGLAAQTTSR